MLRVCLTSIHWSLIVALYLIQCRQTVSIESKCNTENRPFHRRYFYVGGEYQFDTISNESIMVGQMYVEHLTSPYGTQQPFPLVFIHGNGMTGTNWLNTPDGRTGWASYFLSKGYEIYIVDQPSRGRSRGITHSDIALKVFSVKTVEERFTATAFHRRWPQALFHSQWPGENSTTKGRQGDPIFDAFYASIVPSIDNDTLSQMMIQKAGSALLDEIGPAIVITHSQAGPFGWLLADARPHLVKSLIALEPKGPPFREAVFSNKSSRSWGITDIPLTFDPPVNISTFLISTSDNLTSCLQQEEPARRLINLMNISTLIVTAHASYHALYDHCTVEFLRQASVRVDFIRLENVGIEGNGHMLMLEKNNQQIAEFLYQWIIDHLN